MSVPSSLEASTVSLQSKGNEKSASPETAAAGSKDIESSASTGVLAEQQTEQPARTYTTQQWILVLLAIYSSQILYGLDNTIVADIQGPVVEVFGEVEKLGWLGIGFPLGSVATVLTLGKAYAIFDVKWLYITSLVMFTAGSALCGGARDMNSLIVGRVWAGIGGAGMYLGVLNLISINTTLRERPVYIGASGLVWGAGSILGPVVGGAFADSPATWRWAFYLNLILFALFSPIYFFVLKSFSFRQQSTFIEKLRSMDWIGSCLNAAIWTLFAVAFTSAGTIWPWSDHRSIILIVAFVIALLAFAASQYFVLATTTSNRIFPVDFLGSKTLILLYICQACAATVLFVPIYYIPLHFQFAFGDSGMDAAIRLLPFVCIVIAMNMFSGYMMPRYGYYMPWFLLAGLFSVVGGALFYSAVDEQTSAARIYGFSVILAFGAGLCQQSAYSVAPAKVAADRVPDAVAFINTAQIGTVVIALVAGSSVFQSVGFRGASAALEGSGFAAGEIQAALAGQRSLVFSQISDVTRDAVVRAIVGAINQTYLLVLVAGIVGTIAAAMLKREKLIMEMASGG